MEEFGSVLAALLGIAMIPLIGYSVVRLARRWPLATLSALLAFLAAAAGTLGYARYDGYSVDLESRRMTFESELGQWCFTVGSVALVLGVPALPLVVIARARNGAAIGPVGAQWAAVLFGYFMAYVIWGMVLYSWLTGITK